MPALLTIDTLVSLLTNHILHPFPFLLLSLSFLALGYPTTSFHFISPAIPIPTAVPLFALLFLTIWTLRFFSQLDARIASSGAARKLNWEEEVVVITGGLGGLGGMLADVYAMRGVPVAIVDVADIDSAKGRELGEKGIHYWRCDVGDRKQVEKMAMEVKKELGPPTILINNAAIVSGKAFLELTPSELERIYRTNLLSHYHTTQLFLPNMLTRPNGGTIVTLSSVLGYLGCAGLSAYTSSKSALTSLHRSLTAELRLMTVSGMSETKTYPRAISTLLVTPGQLSTPLFRDIQPPNTFLGPTVDVRELVVAIVERIDRGEGGELSMPLYARWIAVLNLLPAGLASLVRGMAGLDRAGWDAFVLQPKS